MVRGEGVYGIMTQYYKPLEAGIPFFLSLSLSLPILEEEKYARYSICCS